MLSTALPAKQHLQRFCFREHKISLCLQNWFFLSFQHKNRGCFILFLDLPVKHKLNSYLGLSTASKAQLSHQCPCTILQQRNSSMLIRAEQMSKTCCCQKCRPLETRSADTFLFTGEGLWECLRSPGCPQTGGRCGDKLGATMPFP